MPEAGRGVLLPCQTWQMLDNRSMPHGPLVPVLAYESVDEAVRWLTKAFGFTLRWQIGDHRAQLAVAPDAALAVTAGTPPTAGDDHVMVRVDDVDEHRRRAREAGAEVTDVEEHVYGERQYTATDPSGRHWVFSQSVRDVDPGEWGATTR